MACERNMIRVVTNMIEKYGGDPSIQNKYGFTALHIAAKEGYLDLTKVLTGWVNKKIFDHKEDQKKPSAVDKPAPTNPQFTPDSYGFNPSYWAYQNGHQEIVNILTPVVK